MEKKKINKCLMCGKEAENSICEACKNKVQAELFYKKKKQEEKGE